MFSLVIEQSKRKDLETRSADGGRQLVGEKRRGEKPIWEPVANN